MRLGLQCRIFCRQGKAHTDASILKFVWGLYYCGKLAYRYGHQPTDACPLCNLRDSCTHIGGECKAPVNINIKRHNAACQLVHAMIRKASKGGGAMVSSPSI